MCYAIIVGIGVTIVYGIVFISLNKREARDLIKALRKN